MPNKASGIRRASTKFVRRPSSLAETERRREWGNKWGSIGADWKKAHNPKG